MTSNILITVESLNDVLVAALPRRFFEATAARSCTCAHRRLRFRGTCTW